MKQPYIINTEMNRIELLDTRFYQDEAGNLFPSSTTILDSYPKGIAFYEWLKQVGDKADEIRDEFGKRGSTVHNLTEMYDLEMEVSIMDEYNKPQYTSKEWSMFEHYVEFSKRFNPKILSIEANYCSAELGYGGTLDRVIELNGKRILIDIKTSNYLHNHYYAQMTSYVKLWEQFNPDLKIDQVAILWLNAKTRTEGKGDVIQGVGWQLKFPEKPMDHWWRVFQATKLLWEEENASMKPRNISYQLTHLK
jgi:hypothetical protein